MRRGPSVRTLALDAFCNNNRRGVWVPAQGRDDGVMETSGTTTNAMTRKQSLQLLLPRRRQALGLLTILLAILLVGAVTAVGAAGDGAEHAVMAGIVTGDAADHGALQAAFCIGGRSCDERECGENG